MRTRMAANPLGTASRRAPSKRRPSRNTQFIVTDVTPSGKEVYLERQGFERLVWVGTERRAERFTQEEAERIAAERGGCACPATR